MISYLDRPQRLRIGVATFHTSIDQLRPDLQQVLLLGAEHINTLTSSDFAVQVEFLGHLTDGNQLVGRNLSTRHPGHHRESSIALDVGEETVVRILQLVELSIHDVSIVKARENGGDGGLAKFTTQRFGASSNRAHDLFE